MRAQTSRTVAAPWKLVNWTYTCTSLGGEGNDSAATPENVPTSVAFPVPCSRMTPSQNSMQGGTVGGGTEVGFLAMSICPAKSGQKTRPLPSYGRLCSFLRTTHGSKPSPPKV